MKSTEAANLDRDAFLAFAAEVEKAARKLREPRQLRLIEPKLFRKDFRC